MLCIGIDTSNYATSLAVFDEGKRFFVINERIDLTVPDGALGLRQNDAVFLHNKNLPVLFSKARGLFSANEVGCVAVSSSPTTEPGSYMPCFLAGISAANAVAFALNVPLFTFSHQQGHIAAAAFSGGLDEEVFYAFHISGGTTDLLLCDRRDGQAAITKIASSLDLHAGQAVDRVGNMLGLSFPSGAALSALAEKCGEKISAKPSLIGGDCSLSGVENQCRKLFDGGASPEYIAKYCITFISASAAGMLAIARKQKNLKCVMAGGVSSSSTMRGYFSDNGIEASFCEPRFSCDNAAGVALLGAKESDGK